MGERDTMSKPVVGYGATVSMNGVVLGQIKSWEMGNSMTETEWLTCTDPLRMLDVVSPLYHGDTVRRLATERQLRLFACACCRQFWHLLWLKSQRALIEMEAEVDGASSDDDLINLCLDEQNYFFQRSGQIHLLDHAARARWNATDAVVMLATSISTGFPTDKGSFLPTFHRIRQHESGGNPDSPNTAGYPAEAHLLRDIIGNPWRLVKLPLAWQHGQRREDSSDTAGTMESCCPWLIWRDGTVPRLAQAIYAEHAWERLPILADALEEAGCANEDILQHLRGAGPHARGCWVLDLLLGRK